MSGGFSELTLFLFGSGFALFVALLGWSEQIRTVSKETRTLENSFLKKHSLNRSQFLQMIRSDDPTKQAQALTEIMQSGTLQTVDQVKLLGYFKQWQNKLTELESLYGKKYSLSIGLTIYLFVAGALSIFSSTVSLPAISLYFFSLSITTLIVIIFLLLITSVLTIILMINNQEKTFHNLLITITDKV